MPFFSIPPALVTAATPLLQSFSGDYTGKQDGGTVKLSLKQASDGSVTGSFNDGSSTASLTGTLTDSGKKITGQFTYQGINLPFEIRRKGSAIEFVMKLGGEEEVMELSRSGGSAPDPEPTPEKPQPSPSVQSKPGSFAGTFKGAEVTLTLAAAGEGKLTGTIVMGDKKYPATAKLVPQGIEGSFKVEEESFEFLAKFEGDSLLLNSGGTTHILLRQGGAKPTNPLASKPTEKPKPSNPLASRDKPTPAAAPVTDMAAGSGFVHPAGLQIKLPKGWQTQSSGPLTMLLPPGATKPDGDEAYLLLVGEANGIQSKTDPRLGQFMELVLNGEKGEGGLILGPGITFQRTGQDSSGLTFQGSNARGNTIYARCVISEPKGRIAAILAVGLKSKIDAREAALQSTMAAVSSAAPEHDSRLLGSWKGTTRTKSIDARDAVGRQQASSVSDSSTTYQLSADGRFLESRWSRTIAIGKGVSIDTGDTVEKTAGQWAASNGKIAFCESNGLYLMGTYQIQGSQVVIQIANKVVTLSRG